MLSISVVFKMFANQKHSLGWGWVVGGGKILTDVVVYIWPSLASKVHVKHNACLATNNLATSCRRSRMMRRTSFWHVENIVVHMCVGHPQHIKNQD